MATETQVIPTFEEMRGQRNAVEIPTFESIRVNRQPQDPSFVLQSPMAQALEPVIRGHANIEDIMGSDPSVKSMIELDDDPQGYRDKMTASFLLADRLGVQPASVFRDWDYLTKEMFGAAQSPGVFVGEFAKLFPTEKVDPDKALEAVRNPNPTPSIWIPRSELERAATAAEPQSLPESNIKPKEYPAFVNAPKHPIRDFFFPQMDPLPENPTPEERIQYGLKFAVAPVLKTFSYYGKGVLLGAPDIAWAAINELAIGTPKEGELPNMSLEDAIDWAMGYNPSGLEKFVREGAELAGNIRTLGIGKGTANPSYTGTIIRDAAAFGGAGAVQEIAKVIEKKIDPSVDPGYEGAKRVGFDTAIGAAFAIFLFPAGKLWVKAFPKTAIDAAMKELGFKLPKTKLERVPKTLSAVETVKGKPPTEVEINTAARLKAAKVLEMPPDADAQMLDDAFRGMQAYAAKEEIAKVGQKLKDILVARETLIRQNVEGIGERPPVVTAPTPSLAFPLPEGNAAGRIAAVKMVEDAGHAPEAAERVVKAAEDMQAGKLIEQKPAESPAGPAPAPKPIDEAKLIKIGDVEYVPAETKKVSVWNMISELQAELNPLETTYPRGGSQRKTELFRANRAAEIRSQIRNLEDSLANGISAIQEPLPAPAGFVLGKVNGKDAWIKNKPVQPKGTPDAVQGKTQAEAQGQVAPTSEPTVAGAQPAPAPAERVTTGTQANIAEERKAMGLDTINSKERQAREQWIVEAKEQGIPEKAFDLASDMLENPRSFTSPAELEGFKLRRVQLEQEWKAADMKARNATNEAEKLSFEAEKTRIEAMDDVIQRASDSAQAEWGRLGVSSQGGIDKNLTAVSVLNRAKTLKGKGLTEAERTGYENSIRDLNEKVEGWDSMKQRIKELETERHIERSKRGPRRQRTEANPERLNSLVAKAREMMKECYT